MSSWKLVEAELPSAHSPVDEKDHNKGGGFKGRRGNGTGTRHRNGRGGRGNSRNIEYYASIALQQIELIFCADNLCMDTYVRAYMDVEGYVPIALVCNYPNVSSLGVPYEKIVEKLMNSTLLEVDTINELIRLKEDWSKWLMPNHYGGRGQPKYLKQQIFYSEDDPNANNYGYQPYVEDQSQSYGYIGEGNPTSS